MTVKTTKGAKFYIGPVVDTDAVNALTENDAISFFEGLSPWVEVEEKEDLGEIGDESEEVTFTAIENGRVRKLKGPRNAGTQTVVCGRDPLDDGQIALAAAEKTDFDYAFMIEYADARTNEYSNSVEYYAGKVMSRPTNLGDNANVTRRTFNIGVNTAIFAVDSELISA